MGYEVVVPEKAIQIVTDHCFGEPSDGSRIARQEMVVEALTEALPICLVVELNRLADDLAKRVSVEENMTEFWVNQVCADKVRAWAAKIIENSACVG